MNTCSICLEEDIYSNLIHPNYCSCKIFLHKQCLKECFKYKIFCPICKTKNIIKINDSNILLKIADKIFRKFINNPNPISFLIFFVTSFIITFTYIIPMLIYIFIKNRIRILN
jgi:hypothetical protein